MQNVINYTDIFQFRLTNLMSIFDLSRLDEAYDAMYNSGVIPLIQITDKNHPLFQRMQAQLDVQGIRWPLQMVIIPVCYDILFTA